MSLSLLIFEWQHFVKTCPNRKVLLLADFTHFSAFLNILRKYSTLRGSGGQTTWPTVTHRVSGKDLIHIFHLTLISTLCDHWFGRKLPPPGLRRSNFPLKSKKGREGESLALLQIWDSILGNLLGLMDLDRYTSFFETFIRMSCSYCISQINIYSILTLTF